MALLVAGMMPLPVLLFAFIWFDGEPGVTSNTEPTLEVQLAQHPVKDRERVDLLTAVAGELLHVDLDQARKLAQEALSLSRELSYDKGQAEAMFALSGIISRMGRYREAATHALDAIQRYEALGDQVSLGRTYNRLAACYHHLGDLDQALNYFFSALKMSEAAEDARGKANALGNIAVVFALQEDYDQALTFFERSLSINRELGRTAVLGIQRNNMAEAYLKKGDLERAREHYQAGLEHNLKSGNQSEACLSYTGLGIVCDELGLSSDALDYFRQAATLAASLPEQRESILARLALARHYLRWGDPQQAIDEGNSILPQAQALDSPELIRDVADILREGHEKLGAYDSAYAYQSLFHQMNERLTNADSAKQMTRLLMQQEMDEREQQVQARLRRQRAILWGVSLGLLGVMILALTFAGIIAVIRKKNRELLAIDSVVKKINMESDLTELLNSLLRETMALFPKAQKGAILVLDRERDGFTFGAVNGYDPAIMQDMVLPYNEAVGRYTQSGEPREAGVSVLTQFEGIPGAERLSEFRHPKSLLAMTLVMEGELKGFFLLENMESPRAFNDLDARTLGRVREHAITAIFKLNALSALRQAAGTDSLTGLCNRRKALERIHQELARSTRTQNAGMVLICDIDHFKQFNDRFGHACGDAVLKSVSSALVHCVRGHDIVCRWGGEEFLIFLPETSIHGGRVVAEKIRSFIEAQSVEYDGSTHHVTLTVGGTMVHLEEPFDTAMDRADQALFQGKRQGRNQVVFDDPK